MKTNTVVTHKTLQIISMFYSFIAIHTVFLFSSKLLAKESVSIIDSYRAASPWVGFYRQGLLSDLSNAHEVSFFEIDTKRKHANQLEQRSLKALTYTLETQSDHVLLVVVMRCVKFKSLYSTEELLCSAERQFKLSSPTGAVILTYDDKMQVNDALFLKTASQPLLNEINYRLFSISVQRARAITLTAVEPS